MKNLLKLEELFFLGFALFLFSGLDYGWGASQYALWFFAPDLSMIAYVMNPRLGAWTYNLIHHKGLAGGALCLGLPNCRPLADVRGDDPARTLEF